jgi:hypothetical protein
MVAIAAIAVASLEAHAQTPQPSSFSIGLFGDLAYAPSREVQLTNVLADIDRAALAFVVHVGDLGSPAAGSCTNEMLDRRLAQFRASAHPLIYTPGDNEWTDCRPQPGIGGGAPLERLSEIRNRFFEGEQSLGKRTLALTRQSSGADKKFAKYRENVRWDFGGVTFATLHVVGSNNSLGQGATTDEEYAERMEANLAWLRENFAHAKANNSRAIMILQQGNIFPEFPPFPGDPNQNPSGYADLREALAREVVAFEKPVVLVHGDSHYFRVDKPFMRRSLGATQPGIANFTRVETFGDPNHHWLEARIDADDPNVFTFRPRLVTPNIGAPP